MSTLAPPSRPAIFDSSVYEWNEKFISGQAQIYASQNTPYVLARCNIPGPSGPTMPLSPAPAAAEELIDCFLNILGDRDAPHGPRTYQDLDLRALCAGCNLRTVEEGLEDSVKKPIALLDDRCHLAHNRLAAAGHRRANSGPLNATQLLVELQKKRYNCDGEPDAERRLLYVTNPDSWAIMVLISTASSEQALCLAEFFYKYLGSKTSLGIHRQPRGVLSFSLEFHLQFYVWREKETLRQDPRKKNNDKPLRRSFQLHCPDGEGQEGASQICIYEAQISCLIAGLDNHSWIAYLLVDTYYQDEISSESVESYHSQEDLKPDPLAAGTVDSDLPIWTPREYFLIVYECRLKQVKHALQNLVSRLLLKLEPYIQDSMTLVPRSVDDGSFSPGQKKSIQQMLNEASRVLRQTIHSICKAVEVWDRFSSRDAAYLSDILRPRSGRPEPIPPFRVIARIGEHIDGLRDLQRLAEQQQELCAGLARKLEMELIMEDNEITTQQQATGELLKTLTVISVLFLPLTTTAALFSMQPGVLPSGFYTGRNFLLCWLLSTFVVVGVCVFFNWKPFWLSRPRRQSLLLPGRFYSLQMRGWYGEPTRSLMSRGSQRDDIELGSVSNTRNFLD